MIHIVVFYLVQIAACWFALQAGGLPERVVALVLLAAAAAASVMSFELHNAFRAVELLLVTMDLGLLVALVIVAMFANRFWPIWLSALHLIAVAVHGVKAYDPTLVPWMYAAAVSKIAYPMLFMLIVGTERHRRRKAEYGIDPDWSLPRSAPSSSTISTIGMPR